MDGWCKPSLDRVYVRTVNQQVVRRARLAFACACITHQLEVRCSRCMAGRHLGTWLAGHDLVYGLRPPQGSFSLLPRRVRVPVQVQFDAITSCASNSLSFSYIHASETSLVGAGYPATNTPSTNNKAHACSMSEGGDLAAFFAMKPLSGLTEANPGWLWLPCLTSGTLL